MQPDRGAVVLRLHHDAHKIYIEVIDRGPGWPDDREKLFDPYFTLRQKGSGLGLAIVQRISHEHGGECELRDTLVDGAKAGATVHMAFEIDEPPRGTPARTDIEER